MTASILLQGQKENLLSRWVIITILYTHVPGEAGKPSPRAARLAPRWGGEGRRVWVLDGAAAPDVVGEGGRSHGPGLTPFQHTAISLRLLGKWIRGHTAEFLSKHPPSLAKMSKWFKPPSPARILRI